jgi:DNA-binding beta-propeller fold protein YncE
MAIARLNPWTAGAIALLGLTAPIAAADKVEFVSGPKVERVGERLVVSFAVNRPTDVEVAVLSADGKVVRHLAAGVLGGMKAPPPPLAPGLSQRPAWDGKDDLGNPASGGPFRFRVRAGMSVTFGRMIGESPYTGSVVGMPYRAPVNGLVVDAAGNLFVKLMSTVGSHGNSGLWPWHLRQFDRNGQYVRTLLPYPPSTDPARAGGFTLLATPGGQFTPANRTSLYPVFYSLGNEIVGRPADNQIVFVHSEHRRLNFFALDGSNRVRTVSWFGEKAKVGCPAWLDVQVALSPDGKFAYYSNLAGVAYDGKKPSDIDPNWPQGRIYRQDLTRPGAAAERFFDLTLPDFDKTRYWMPSAWDKKTAAAGIDVDAAGNVLVCDLVSQQIVELSPDGRLLSTTKCPWPDRVMVNRKSGDLYVISRGVSRGALPAGRLIKIVGRGESARVAAELALEGTVGGAMTVDQSGPTAVLWLGGRRREQIADSDALVRIEDRGGKLVVAGDKFLNRDENAITFLGYADVDPEAELVYVTRSGGTVWRFDGNTGAGGPLPLKAVDLAIGPGGHIYTWGVSGGYEGPLARFTRDLKPAPLPGGNSHTFGYVYGRAGRGSSVCGMDVDARGRVFATYGTNECHVRVYDERGALVEYPRRQKVSEKGGKDVPAAITGVSGYGGSIRVDAAGNIYVLQQGVPKDFAPPAGFEKDEAYRNAAGTIHKFPPEGGEVDSSNGNIKAIRGAIATYPGCGPVSRWQAVGACACTKPRFDLDGFGRLYIPDGIAFAVSIRDNAGNEIVRFGAYGNFDCRGVGSREPSPAIPLGWPVTAGASDKYVYVGDCLNHRVVRVDKQFAATATVGE